MIKKSYFIIILLLIFLSCISTKEINEKWNGKTITELKIYFGEPSIIIEKENNDKEFIYKKKTKRPSSFGQGKQLYIIETKIFFINKLDKIYNVIYKKKTLS